MISLAIIANEYADDSFYYGRGANRVILRIFSTRLKNILKIARYKKSAAPVNRVGNGRE